MNINKWKRAYYKNHNEHRGQEAFWLRMVKKGSLAICWIIPLGNGWTWNVWADKNNTYKGYAATIELAMFYCDLKAQWFGHFLEEPFRFPKDIK